ncbi:hypothetical protein ACQ1Z7_15675, partial [Enterococcus faecalis]
KPVGSSVFGTFTGVVFSSVASSFFSLVFCDFRFSDSVSSPVFIASFNIPNCIAANTYSGTFVWFAIDGAPAFVFFLF